jgi:hypothetical protein
MPKPLSFRELRRRLLDHDRRFRFRPGKGSEVVLSHPGFLASCLLPHHGDGTTVRRPALRKIVRDFGLPRGFFDARHRRKALPATLTPHVVVSGA